MPTPMHQQQQREHECHLTMPHTHTKKGCVIEKQRGDGMDGDTHLADEVAHTQMVWQSEVTMQVLMHTTVSTHWPHHTTLPSMCVCVCVWRWHHACVVSQWWLHTNQWMNQATVLQCHQSQSQSCVCGKSGVEVAMVAMSHTP